MRYPLIVAIAALACPAGAAAQSMVCHPVYKGNDLGPITYRLAGPDLYQIQPDGSSMTFSSATRRVPLGRTVDKGVVTHTFASHRVVGQVLTRTVYWQTGRAPMRARFSDRYDFGTRRIAYGFGQSEQCA